MSYQYEYPRPAVAVDLIVVRRIDESNEVLLIERKNEPFAGQWALPGGFLDEGESLEQAATRELQEETGVAVSQAQLQQVRAWSEPTRDPRTRVISVAFLVFVASETEAVAADDAAEARWFNFQSLPDLAFDHSQMIAEVRSVVG